MAAVRVGVNGARGKMGTVAVQAVQSSDGMELVFSADREDDLGALIAASGAEVVVDFTLPSAVFENTMTIIRSGARPLVGTTGLKQGEISLIRDELVKRELGGIVAPNFSLGALLMMKLAAEAGAYFSDVEIIETHHEAKIDAPSGTARLTAKAIAEERDNETAAPSPGESGTSRGELHHGILIHSVRLPGKMAHQEVVFGGMGETLTIRHDSISRSCFVPGILLAVRRVMEITGLECGLSL